MRREIGRPEQSSAPALPARPADGERHRHGLTFGRSLFPDNVVARIFRPGRSVTTSGKARTKGWRLTLARRSAPYIEPLMGWTGDDDTLTQVELTFPTLEAAVAYCERQGLGLVIEHGAIEHGVIERGAIEHGREARDADGRSPARHDHSINQATGAGRPDSGRPSRRRPPPMAA